MRFTSESKLFLGIILATLAIIGIAAFVFSQPATPLSRARLIVKDTLTRGNPNAQAYLVEFSDFQCPACRDFQPVVNQISQQYQDGLLFGYRHFPLDQHPFAQKAAVAAEAAGQQGKFWEMSDLIFANQDKLSDELFVTLAKQLNLDLPKFQEAREDPKLKAKVSADRDAGLALGITATPTFFLNGKKLTNYRSFDEFKQIIREELAK